MSAASRPSAAPPARILVVDDEPDLRALYELALLREGHDVDTADGVEAAWQQLAERGYQLVITDMRLPDGSGLDLLRRLQSAGRREPALVITAYGSAENAVESLKAGAFDYLTKPVDLKMLRSLVAAALRERAGAAAALSVPTSEMTSQAAPIAPAAGGGSDAARAALARLVGRSAAMEQVRQLILRVARGMAPVLVQGESGTGKELVARAIHAASVRADGPFVAVNCGAIPEHLLESEFFGHRRGAFTGATEDRPGFFQAAHGGTLFLDEIGELPLAMQSKLLRAVQERSVRAVGATAEAPVDVRLVSATHRDLAAAVQAGSFRQDLFYRLNVIALALPALRERIDDLPELAGAILARLAREAGEPQPAELSAASLAALSRQAFPGNVRELENMLMRAVTLASSRVLDPEDLGVTDEGFERAAPTAPMPLLPAAGAHAAPARQAVGEPAALPADLQAHLDAVERAVLVRALELHRHNRTAAGAALGLSLRQMRYRMARLGIRGGGEDGAEGSA